MAVRIAAAVTADLPARLDRLRWSRFHSLVVVALGSAWLLDGLEVTIIGSVGPGLQDRRSLGLSPGEIGLLASGYVAGATAGALLFGWLADRSGRLLAFRVTLVTYLVGVAASAFSWDFASLDWARVVTGAGIGGEYAAINSAIDEIVPARLRGRVALYVNGSYWIGAILGAGLSLILLDTRLVPANLGWRIGFGLGGSLGVGLLLLRRGIPESPRWLICRGRLAEAEQVVRNIEAAATQHSSPRPAPTGGSPNIGPPAGCGFRGLMALVFGRYRGRAVVVLILMIAQAFLFNALFFTYGLVLTEYYQVPTDRVGLYILALSMGNLLGPLALGRFFDTIGRRVMMTMTFAATAVLVAATALAFARGHLSGMTQTCCWMASFFFASAAASSVYLSASESFPVEIRALAIACFYAAGTALGGIAGPWLFGEIIGTGSRGMLAMGYLLAALLMAVAAIVVWKFGIDAENQPLEALTLTADDRPSR